MSLGESLSSSVHFLIVLFQLLRLNTYIQFILIFHFSFTFSQLPRPFPSCFFRAYIFLFLSIFSQLFQFLLKIFSSSLLSQFYLFFILLYFIFHFPQAVIALLRQLNLSECPVFPPICINFLDQHIYLFLTFFFNCSACQIGFKTLSTYVQLLS
jgi:hypothetical protein